MNRKKKNKACPVLTLYIPDSKEASKIAKAEYNKCSNRGACVTSVTQKRRRMLSVFSWIGCQGSFLRELLLIRILQCWKQIGQVGNRKKAHTKISDILNCMDFSGRVSKSIIGEKEGEGHGPGSLAGEKLLNVKLERRFEVWFNCGQQSKEKLSLNPASLL